MMVHLGRGRRSPVAERWWVANAQRSRARWTGSVPAWRSLFRRSVPCVVVFGGVVALAALLESGAAFAGATTDLLHVTGGEATSSGAPRAASRESRPGRRWRVEVDPEAIFALAPGEVAGLPLPGRARREIVLERIEAHPSGNRSWIGHVVGFGGDFPVVVTVGAHGVAGILRGPDGDLRIEPDRDGNWLVEATGGGLAPAPAFDDVAIPPLPELPGPASRGGAFADAESGGDADGAVEVPFAAGTKSGKRSIVDILVLHTKGLAQRYGGHPELRIESVVALANQAFADSGVKLRLRVVGLVEVGHPETGSNFDALYALTDARGAFTGVPALREAYGADLVTFVRPFDDASHQGCGTGWIGGWSGRPIAESEGFAYSVVSDGSNQGLVCDDVTFAHEISHNLGCMHDRATVAGQGGGEGAYPYAFGYGIPGRFGTVMSYIFPRLARFSNPDKSCLGFPCGIDEARSDGANNALAIDRGRAVVAKYRPMAQLDFRFGDAGRARIGVGAGRAAASAVAVQADGRPVVVGALTTGTANPVGRPVVVRLDENGDPDPDFGDAGVVFLDVPGRSARAEAVAIRPDGLIVVAGTLEEGSGSTASSSVFVARLRADGAIDAGFADKGLLVFSRDGGSIAAGGLALGADGNLTIAATVTDGSGEGAAAALRLNRRGRADRAFGTGGLAEVAVPGGAASARAIAVAEDGSVVLAGALDRSTGSVARSDLLVVRLTRTGEPDAEFGRGGAATASLGQGSAGATGLALQSDGSPVAAGWFAPGDAPAEVETAVVRFTSAGVLDRAFASAGVFRGRLGADAASASSIVVQDDGRIVTAGSLEVPDQVGAQIFVLRLRPGGARDPDFGERGVARTPFAGASATARALGLAPDGGIVVAGGAAVGNASSLAVARYLKGRNPPP